jgi:hypothetical protein
LAELNFWIRGISIAFINSTATSAGPKKTFNWREDLSASRDLSRNEVQAFGLRHQAAGWNDPAAGDG